MRRKYKIQNRQENAEHKKCYKEKKDTTSWEKYIYNKKIILYNQNYRTCGENIKFNIDKKYRT